MLKNLIFFFILPLITAQNLYSQKVNAEIIKYEINCNISSDNILTKETSVIIQINNRAGEDLTEISIPYSENVPVTILIAQLQTPAGNIIRKLKKKEITIKSDISYGALYEDDFKKTFTLKHNTYPYQIVYSYKKTYKKFFNIVYWSPVFDFDYPTKNAVLTIKKPSDYKIIIDQNNISKPESHIIGNSVKYTWTGQYLKLIKNQIYAPSSDEIIPYVKIAPEIFNYGVPGNQKDWIYFGNWITNLNKGLNYLPETEKNNIDKIINNLTTKKEKINALYKYLQQNTRYINVSIDVGGYKPHSASYVAENKYGDCKALTNYMKSVFSYTGIKSYYSLIYAGDKIKPFKKEFTTSQFNHVILMIPNKTDTTWLECTSKSNPTGYVGTSTQGRYALVVEKDNSKLIKTPELKINDTEVKRTISFRFQNNGTCSTIANIKLKGYMFEYIQSFSSNLNSKQKNRFIHKFIPFNNYELTKWDIKKTNNSKPETELNFELTIKNYIKTYDNLKFINLFPTEIPDFEKPKIRTQSILINYPINKHDSLIYDKIENYGFQSMNDTILISKYGKYTFKTKITENNLIIDKQFILYSGKYPVSDYHSFYDFINSVKNIERKNPIVYIKKN